MLRRVLAIFEHKSVEEKEFGKVYLTPLLIFMTASSPRVADYLVHQTNLWNNTADTDGFGIIQRSP